jgi:hypothetical protein
MVVVVAKGGRGGGNQNNTHGDRGGGGRGCFGHGGKGGRGGGRPQGGGFQAGIFCQLCEKEGHTIVKCFKRFDASFSGPP